MYKIMIIDDDPTSLAIGKAFLGKEYDVSLMHSGHQALGALKSTPYPDLILLDMFMPGISGMDFLKAVQEIEHLREIPIIILSSNRDLDTEVEGYKNGASDFLQKPVNQYLLKRKIEHYLSYVVLKQENAELKARAGV